uniref:EGF-like domain-containing protein n=1 Tax=Panagrellus redivivus TaxID=6233 RepID=A0A7E4VLN8_PANRE
MRLALVLSISILAIHFLEPVSAGIGFLRDQRKCKVKCQNGGVCAFKIGDEQVHSCICLTNVYYGDLCQYQVTTPSPTQRILITTTNEPLTTPTSTETAEFVQVTAEEEENSAEFEEVRDEVILEEGTAPAELVEAAPKSVENEDFSEGSEVPGPEGVPANLEHPGGHYYEPDTQQYQSSKTTHSVEQNLVEEQDGWMMVKRKTNSAPIASGHVSVVFSVIAAFFIRRFFAA